MTMKKNYGVDIKWLAVSCFELRVGETTVVTDPYITECVGTDCTWEDVEDCQIITLGHAHWDHITDIPRLGKKFNPLILCGDHTAYPLTTWLNYSPTRVYPMNPGLELDFGDIKILALYGRHTELGMGLNDLLRDRIGPNPICQSDPGIAALQGIGSLEYRNFLYTLPNGTKILLWGNDPTVDQINLCKALKPDIGLIQYSSRQEVLEARAELAAEAGCKVLIPHHHDFKSVTDPAELERFGEAFLKRVPDGTFVNPNHGEWIHL